MRKSRNSVIVVASEVGCGSGARLGQLREKQSLTFTGRRRRFMCGGGQDGFTLLELLAGLAVAGVATSVFITLYSISVLLATTSRNEQIALQVAESHLNDILSYPEQIEWPDPATLVSDEPVLVMSDVKEALPEAMPTQRRAYDRVSAVYYDISWEAGLRLPEPDAPYAELTVTVKWQEQQKWRTLALTSAIPRPATAGSTP